MKNLQDSTFQDFIARKPFGLCKALPNNLKFVLRLSSLRRSLIDEGSHRHLSSSVRLDIQLKAPTEIPPHTCAVIILERLPSGVYADPFELQNLLQHGEFSDIAVFGDTNLESPSFLSNRSAIEVHVDVGPLLSSSKNELDVVVELPLHARYAPLHESGYWNVKFGEPDLFMRCSVEGSSSNQSCLYAVSNENDELKYGTMVWKIPCGRKAHAGVVYVFSFISAFVATLVIVLTSIMYSNVGKCKDVKKI